MGNFVLFDDLSPSRKKITKALLKYNKLVSYQIEGKTFIDLRKLNQFIKWEENFINEHYTDLQFWRLLGHTGGRKGLKGYYKNLVRLQEEGFIKLKKLDFPLITVSNNPEYALKTRFVRKLEVSNILKNYIPFKEAANLLGINEHHAITRLKELDISHVTFMKRSDFKYFHKGELDNYLSKKNMSPEEKLELTLKSEDLINRSVVMKILNINSDIYKKLVNNGLLKIVEQNSRNIYFEKSEIYAFKEEQIKMINEFEERYYTREEILNEFDVNVDAIHVEIRKKEIPFHIKGRTKFRASKYAYFKEDIQEEFFRRSQRQLYYTEQGTIFNNVIHRLSILKIDFSPRANLTKRLWLRYIEIRSSLFKSKNISTKISRISDFVNTSRILSERLRDKEILSCSSKELNTSFFNNMTDYNVQLNLFKFLKELARSSELVNKIAFKMRDIRNPYTIPVQQRIKEIYSISEFRALFRYINDIKRHKTKAINSVKEAVLYLKDKNTIKYNKYDSAWLYLLIHLNNGWRHWDCTEVPRISFKGTDIEDSLEWLENNDISMEDAKKIVNKLQIKFYRHSKTGAERYLFCSDQLTLAFAYAVVICELRTRRLNPLSDSIVNFYNKNRNFYPSIHKEFFWDFKENVKFESLKMNRTILTLAFNLSREMGGTAHEVEIVKYLRNHKNIDVTNIYIVLSQDDIFFLSNQIFSREFFGFIPDTFAELLFGSELDVPSRTKQIQLINSKVGKYIKLEAYFNFINHYLNNEEFVKEIIMDYTQQEIKEKYNKILIGKLPSKEENIQCLISEEGCAYPGRECVLCHYSIPNFFAISTICESLLINIEELNDIERIKFRGDKERIAITFLKNLRLFKKAFYKFGDVIFDFMDIDEYTFERILKELPSLQYFLPNNK